MPMVNPLIKKSATSRHTIISLYLQRIDSHPAIQAALFYLATLFIVFYRVLFGRGDLSGLARLYDTDIFYRAVAPARIPFSPSSFVRTDVSPSWLTIPQNIQATSAWHHHVFPLWDPSLAMGAPLFANAETGLFFPLNLLFFIFGVLPTINYILIGQLWVAGYFLYQFARLYGLQHRSALLVGLSYMLSGSLLSDLSFTLVHTFCLFPLGLLAAEYLARRPHILTALFYGVVGGLFVLSGQAEAAFLIFSSCCVYLLLRWLTYSVVNRVSIRSMLSWVSFALVITVGSIAIEVLPFAQYLREGSSYNLHGGTFTNPVLFWQDAGLPLLINVFVPYTSQGIAQNSFVGISTLLLSMFGLFYCQQHRALLGILLWALFLEIFLFPSPFPLLPVLIHSFYNTVNITLPLCLFAGVGLDRVSTLLVSPQEKMSKWRSIFAYPWVTSAVLFVLGGIVAGIAQSEVPGVLFLLPAVEGLLFALCYYLGQIRRFSYAPHVIFFLAWLGLVGYAYLLTIPQPQFTYQETPALQALQGRATQNGSQPYRVAGVALDAPSPRLGAIFNFGTVTTVDPVKPQRYTSIYPLLGIDSTKSLQTIVLLGKLHISFLSLLNVRYLVVPHRQDITTQVQREPGQTLTQVRQKTHLFYSDATLDLYENTAALSRAFLVHSARYYRQYDVSRVLQDMNQHVAELGQTVLLETPNGAVPEEFKLWADTPSLQNNPHPKTEHVRVQQYTNETVTVEVTANSRAYLVLSDTWYPGWEARIDNHLTPIYPADALLRAIAIPPGHHIITFSYHPVLYSVGATITLFTWLMVLALLLGRVVWLRIHQTQPATVQGRELRDGEVFILTVLLTVSELVILIGFII